MLEIGLITLFPEMFSALDASIIGKAQARDLLRLHFWSPRDFTKDKHRTVDDKPYGGGPGMLMKYTPLYEAIMAAKKQLGNATPVIYLSPQGQPLTQQRAQALAAHPRFILLCGRYEGIDARLLETVVDQEISLGDFVVSGGEIPAMAIIDACTRLLPGALGDEDSAQADSFTQGLLEYSQYTRPEIVANLGVPEVLLRGDHQAIARWRMKSALANTWRKRPDLLQSLHLSHEQQTLLNELITEQGQKP